MMLGGVLAALGAAFLVNVGGWSVAGGTFVICVSVVAFVVGTVLFNSTEKE